MAWFQIYYYKGSKSLNYSNFHKTRRTERSKNKARTTKRGATNQIQRSYYRHSIMDRVVCFCLLFKWATNAHCLCWGNWNNLRHFKLFQTKMRFGSGHDSIRLEPPLHPSPNAFLIASAIMGRKGEALSLT